MHDVILIVEDDVGSRIVLEKGLRSKGYTVFSAVDGGEALALLEQHKVNLIISDIMMPHMDGYELCRRVKAEPTLSDIPFIFYTATFLGEQEEQLGLQLGAKQYLAKPMELDALVSLIQPLLKQNSKREVAVPDLDVEHYESLYSKVISKKLEKKVGELQDERKKRQQTESKLHHLMEDLRQDYFLYRRDLDGSYVYVSPSIQNILECSEDVFIQHHAEYVTQHPCNQEAYKLFQLAVQGLEQKAYPVQLQYGDASPRELECSEHPVWNAQGVVIAVEGIAHDVTAYKDLKRQFLQAQKMEAVGALVGGIAHDFNNMLAGIVGNIYLAKRSISQGASEKAVEKLDSVEVLSQQAAAMVSRLLGFSRKGVQHTTQCSLNAFVKEALKLARVTIPENIQVASHIASEELLIQADVVQLQQVLLNLLNNARDALEAVSSPSITISVSPFVATPSFIDKHEGIQTTRFAQLMVCDNGAGISEEHLAHVFEPFFTTKGVGKGTGLGLSMVRSAIEQHHGVMEVERVADGGTAFYVYLPCVELAAQISPLQRNRTIVQGHGEVILLADDDMHVRSTTAQVLESFNYRVLQAEHGMEAWEILQKHDAHIDMLVLDVVMPELSGLDLAKKVRARDEALPILLMTGYDKNHAMLDEAEQDHIEVLMKPIPFHILSQSVRRLLDQH